MVEPLLEKWQRVRYNYPAQNGLRERTLVHVLYVGDGKPPETSPNSTVKVSDADGQVQISLEGGQHWYFSGPPREKTSNHQPFAIQCRINRGIDN